MNTGVDAMKSMSIAGNWDYQLDPEDIGIAQKWYENNLKHTGFVLPGTTSENKLGEPWCETTELCKDTVQSLRQRYRYVGAAWYQINVAIPAEWSGKRVLLLLERVMFESSVWIGANPVGKQDSLSVSHVYDITDYINAGANHQITIRIDNRDVQNIGSFRSVLNPSAYTDETQTIWNGIVGKIMLYCTDKVFFEDIQVYPDISGKKVRIRTKLGNRTNSGMKLTLTVSLGSTNTQKCHRLLEKSYEYIMSGTSETYVFEYDMGDEVLLWDEFAPALYEMEITLTAEISGQRYYDKKTITFGMREFTTAGTQFTINGRKTLLRGTLDCCIYPLTGYPPTEVDAWRKVFNIVKEYGLNHVRFHSWCPPEAAFEAADHLGVYLQVEGPLWLDPRNGYGVGGHPSHFTYFPAEAVRVIEAYGNHPSFCLYSCGNELRGDFTLLHDIIEELKSRDKRIVYTLTSNWDRPVDSADDFFIAQTVENVGIRGQYFLNEMVEGTNLDFQKGVQSRNIPIVSHEVGQYSVYPDINEISKYIGVLRPVNFEVIRKDLADKNMLEQADKFTLGSGRLAVQLYKDEIEAALRTKGFGGFQLLDIHDFPGQSTATVGFLNSFWESKELIEPEQFRQFCSETVPLVRLPKRIYTNQDVLSASIEIANFGAEPILNANIQWKISEAQGAVIFSGVFKNVTIPVSNGIQLGTIEDIRLDTVTTASKLTLSVSIEHTNIENTWDLWVYPAELGLCEEELAKMGNILITSTVNAEMEKHLKEGKSVLLLPEASAVKEKYPGKFFPVFWSPVHFANENPCGIYCDNHHPAFAKFPTDFFSGYQWKNLLENSFSLSIDAFPSEFTPVVQVIPNFFYNHRLTNLFETNVYGGKLVVCSIDIESGLDKRIEARQLRRSLLSYMAGESFAPVQNLTWEQIRGLFADNE